MLYLSSVLCVLSIYAFYDRYQSSLDRKIITTLLVPSGYLFLVELPRPSLLGAHLCLATNFFVVGFVLRACLA